MTEIYIAKGAIDWDDTLADTVPKLAEFIHKNSEIEYPSEKLFGGRVIEAEDPTLFRLRQRFLRSQSHIPTLPALPYIKEGLVKCKNFSRFQLLTGKLDTLYIPLVEWLLREEVYGLFTKLNLRPEDQEDQEKYKVDKVIEEKYDYIVDNDGNICKKVSRQGVFSALIHRPEENGDIPDGPLLKRYNGVIDFANDVESHGNWEAFITAHQKKFETPSSRLRSYTSSL